MMKVCGMRDEKNILDVAAWRPDFMGFIFYRKSPRFVGDNFSIPEEMPREIKRVGVFVNETTGVILEKIKELELQYVQLHGDESVEQCRELRGHGVGVIKVFSVDDDMDFGLTAAYVDVADYFLFDTKGRLYGGNSKRFDWDILKKYDQRIPFFLSGGIAPEHVEEIRGLSGLNLAAIDINSGVEVEPGLKDVRKVSTIRLTMNTNQ